MAEAVWVLRSRTEPDFVKQKDGPAGSAGVRGGVCAVSRNAACEAPNAEVGVQFVVAFAGVSERGEIVSGVCAGAEGTGPAGAVSGTAQRRLPQSHRDTEKNKRSDTSRACREWSGSAWRIRKQIPRYARNDKGDLCRRGRRNSEEKIAPPRADRLGMTIVPFDWVFFLLRTLHLKTKCYFLDFSRSARSLAIFFSIFS